MARPSRQASRIVEADDVPNTPQLGQTSLPGLKRTGNYVFEEFLRELYGRKAMRIYREMRDNCPITGAMMFLVRNLLKSVDWHWAPKDPNKPEDVEAQEFLAQAFDEMDESWSDTVEQIADMFVFGWALAEQVFYKHPDGRILWKKWVFIAQESLHEWIFDEEDTPVAMLQIPPSDYIQRDIPLNKCLHFRTTRAKNNPEGRSLLRNAYTSWFYKVRLQEIEAIGVERDLAGMPVLKIPMRYMTPQASAAEKAFYNQCQIMIRNIRRDEHEGVILPSDTDQNGNPLVHLELLSTGGSRTMDVDRIIQRYEQRQAMTWLADFILLGHEKVGSFALSDDKTDLFAVALGAFLKDIASVINKQGADLLLSLNGKKGKARIVPGDLEKAEIEKIVTALTSLVSGGIIMPDPALEGWARELIGAPKAGEDFIDENGTSASGVEETDRPRGVPTGDPGQGRPRLGGPARDQPLDASKIRQ